MAVRKALKIDKKNHKNLSPAKMTKKDNKKCAISRKASLLSSYVQ
jgi:hypothetical protein